MASCALDGVGLAKSLGPAEVMFNKIALMRGETAGGRQTPYASAAQPASRDKAKASGMMQNFPYHPGRGLHSENRARHAFRQHETRQQHLFELRGAVRLHFSERRAEGPFDLLSSGGLPVPFLFHGRGEHGRLCVSQADPVPGRSEPLPLGRNRTRLIYPAQNAFSSFSRASVAFAESAARSTSSCLCAAQNAFSSFSRASVAFAEPAARSTSSLVISSVGAGRPASAACFKTISRAKSTKAW